MTPQSLTVLAPLRPESTDALRRMLRSVGDDINRTKHWAHTTPPIEFRRSRRTHFARFAILTDPDRGAGRTRLLYASIYDGTLDEHIDELVAITGQMDAIWGACEGYTGIGAFAAFIRAHAYEPAAFYIAFRNESVASINRGIDARHRREASDAVVTAPVRTSRRASGVQRLLRAAPLPLDVVRAMVRHGLTNVFFGTRQIVASLDRYPIFRVVNWLTRNRMPPLATPFSSVPLREGGPTPAPVAGDEIPADSTDVAPSFREDAVAQNQLTVVTVVPPAALDRVAAVMAAIDAYAKRLAPPGSLIGISTIHFVRWLLIDEGRRLMLVSDYDGSWESYLDEFAEMIVSGLDAIWGGAVGAPPAGARDVFAFKRFLRTHQVPADVFFSAYPNETVLNIAADTAAAGSVPHAPSGEDRR